MLDMSQPIGKELKCPFCKRINILPGTFRMGCECRVWFYFDQALEGRRISFVSTSMGILEYSKSEDYIRLFSFPRDINLTICQGSILRDIHIEMIEKISLLC